MNSTIGFRGPFFLEIIKCINFNTLAFVAGPVPESWHENWKVKGIDSMGVRLCRWFGPNVMEVRHGVLLCIDVVHFDAVGGASYFARESGREL